MTLPQEQVDKLEEKRLKDLYSFQILDTEPEKAFDELTDLAAYICDSKMALVSLIERNRQFFKSKKGVDLCETPRNISFCSHAIKHQEDVFIVTDATKDERFKDNPLVTSKPYIRFYAGVPLVSKSGNALGTLCVLDDKPSQISASQISALKKLAAQVCRILENRKQTRYLKESRTQIEEQSKLIKEIVFTIAHDLKSPMSSMKSLLEYLRDDYKNELDDKAQLYIDYAIESNEKVLKLIKDTLEFAKTGVNGEENVNIDINSCIKDILILNSTEIIAHNIQVDYIDLPEIISKEMPVNIVFRNLINNAIKYRHPERDLKIEITCEDVDNYWQFSIADNGIGIAQKNYNHIFKLFRRLHNDSNGIGMGLALCKKIILSLGGKIWVESEEEVGSTFKFTIPKNKD